MNLDHDFWVPLPTDEAWTVLTDIPRIAPCLPGAQLDETVDGEYRGRLRTTIGPVTADYHGTARFAERDEVDHRAVIVAHGTEQRGSGAVAATITAALRPDSAGTHADLSIALTISGPAAEFGRSLAADASAAMLTEFAQRLENLLRAGDSTTVPEPTPSQQTNQLDAVRTLALPVLRRLTVPVICATVAGVLGWHLGRRVPTRRD